MNPVTESIRYKGYIPLAASDMVAIGWQGEELDDFWMWNRKYSEYENGIKQIRTVQVRELKEAALRYWLDNWIPIKPVTDDLLRRMESAIRAVSKGRARQDIPDGEFLEKPEHIPLEVIGPEVREKLGLPLVENKERLVAKSNITAEIISSLKAQFRGRG